MRVTVTKQIEVTISDVPELASADLQARLFSELRTPRRLSSSAVPLTWASPPLWKPDGRALQLVCLTTSDELQDAAEEAVRQAALAIGVLVPRSDATVRVAHIAVVAPPRPIQLSTIDRWGWYSVTLSLESAFLDRDPAVAGSLAEQLAQMKRFRKASLVRYEREGRAVIQIETRARSPHAADGEARDAVENLIWTTLKDPGEYAIESRGAAFISEE